MKRIMPTTESIIERFKAKHGDTYDYSKVVYTGVVNNVEIICKKHGSFFQTPGNHIFGKGCLKCGREKLISLRTFSQDEFIKRFKEKHGDKYDYSKAIIKNGESLITITCTEHGDFVQKAYYHLYGRGCIECGKLSGNITRTQETFIQDSIKIHGETYDYSKVKYTNIITPVTIGCKLHGEFEQTPKSHLKGMGCPLCGNIKRRISTEEYFDRVRKKHGDKYDYSETGYKGMYYPITYKCPVHGYVTQNGGGHLTYGCRQCAVDNLVKPLDVFISELKELYGDYYKYDKITYIDDITPVVIICPIHGDVRKIPNDLRRGGGCPVCSASTGEKAIYMWLKNNNFRFYREYKLPGYRYRFDFYIPDLKVFIEHHGIQHYKPISHWGGNDGLRNLQLSDRIKRGLIKNLGCDLITITYLEESNIENVLIERLSKFIRYKKDGLYFRDFAHFSKHYNLPDDAKPETYKQYMYYLNLNSSPV